MPTAYKILLLIVLAAVIFELFQALYFMMKDRGEGNRTVKALTWRVSTQLLLVALIVLGWWMGWLDLHGVAP